MAVQEGDILESKSTGVPVRAASTAPPWPIEISGQWGVDIGTMSEEEFRADWRNVSAGEREAKWTAEWVGERAGIVHESCGQQFDVTNAYRRALSNFCRDHVRDKLIEAGVSATGGIVPIQIYTFFMLLDQVQTFDHAESAVKWFDDVEWLGDSGGAVVHTKCGRPIRINKYV